MEKQIIQEYNPLRECVNQCTEHTINVENGVVKSVTLKSIIPYPKMIETGTGYINLPTQVIPTV